MLDFQDQKLQYTSNRIIEKCKIFWIVLYFTLMMT